MQYNLKSIFATCKSWMKKIIAFVWYKEKCQGK